MKGILLAGGSGTRLHLGLSASNAVQNDPRGLADAFRMGYVGVETLPEASDRLGKRPFGLHSAAIAKEASHVRQDAAGEKP